MYNGYFPINNELFSKITIFAYDYALVLQQMVL